MNVEKYINSIKAKTQAKIDRLYEEAKDAYDNWADTGYNRYMTKKERLEDEAYQLERFINPNSAVAEVQEKLRKVQDEKEELVLLMRKVKNIVDDMKCDFPDTYATRCLENVVGEFKYDILSRK